MHTHTHTHTHIYIYIYIIYAELNPICHLLALLGAHHILHVSRIRVKESKIYIETLKTLLHVSITRSPSGSIYCSLLKL